MAGRECWLYRRHMGPPCGTDDDDGDYPPMGRLKRAAYFAAGCLILLAFVPVFTALWFFEEVLTERGNP